MSSTSLTQSQVLSAQRIEQENTVHNLEFALANYCLVGYVRLGKRLFNTIILGSIIIFGSLSTSSGEVAKTNAMKALERIELIIDALCKEKVINDLVDDPDTQRLPGFDDGGLHYFQYRNKNATVYFSKNFERQPEPPPASYTIRRVVVWNIRRYLNRSILEQLDRPSVRKVLKDPDGYTVITESSDSEDTAMGETSEVWLRYKDTLLSGIEVWCGD
jgi:hypothetical protein